MDDRGTGTPEKRKPTNTPLLSCHRLRCVVMNLPHFLRPLCGGAALLLAGAVPAGAATFNVNGTLYDVTTFTGSYSSYASKFKTPANGGTMPWWGSEGLARDFANTVQMQLVEQDIGGLPGGPFFAYNSYSGGITARFYYVEYEGSEADFSPNSTYVFAEVIPTQPPAAPAPLPLFGAGAAFGISRRLRRRINKSR